jgi:hypothetical protein
VLSFTLGQLPKVYFIELKSPQYYKAGDPAPTFSFFHPPDNNLNYNKQKLQRRKGISRILRCRRKPY